MRPAYDQLTPTQLERFRMDVAIDTRQIEYSLENLRMKFVTIIVP